MAGAGKDPVFCLLVYDRSITQPGVILITLSPPSERRDHWGDGTVNGRTRIYPLRFNTWGNWEIYIYMLTHAQAFLEIKRWK